MLLQFSEVLVPSCRNRVRSSFGVDGRPSRGFSMELIGQTTWIPYLGEFVGLLVGSSLARYLINRGHGALWARKVVALVCAVIVPLSVIGRCYQLSSALTGSVPSCYAGFEALRRTMVGRARTRRNGVRRGQP